ncbi:MAG: FAD-dependent oxidoreductase, partial [Anaerolineaceae bacterium]|nr:FAD-dependent oxidoreductase [Anaerolineaceae bacterium]
PLQLRHTVKRVIGNDRVEAIESVLVDEQMRPVPGTEEIIPCDTLLLSVGLIPENELSRKAGVLLDPIVGGPVVDDSYQTNIPGIFAAGNVVHVYDLADWVTQAGLKAGENAALFAIREKKRAIRTIPTVPGDNIRYVVPQKIIKDNLTEGDIPLQLRVSRPIETPVRVLVKNGDEIIAKKNEMYARPGEMITIKLQSKHYDQVNHADRLIIEVEAR